MAISSDFRSGRHVVYNLNAHLVFLPKYRKQIITPKVFDTLKEAWVSVCADFGCGLLEAGYAGDHVHLLVSYPPKVSLSKLVNSLKGVSSRRLRAENLPEINGALWQNHFWSPSYCAVSSGGDPLDIIKRYIENQNEKDSSPS